MNFFIFVKHEWLKAQVGYPVWATKTEEEANLICSLLQTEIQEIARKNPSEDGLKNFGIWFESGDLIPDTSKAKFIEWIKPNQKYDLENKDLWDEFTAKENFKSLFPAWAKRKCFFCQERIEEIKPLKPAPSRESPESFYADPDCFGREDFIRKIEEEKEWKKIYEEEDLNGNLNSIDGEMLSSMEKREKLENEKKLKFGPKKEKKISGEVEDLIPNFQNLKRFSIKAEEQMKEVLKTIDEFQTKGIVSDREENSCLDDEPVLEDLGKEVRIAYQGKSILLKGSPGTLVYLVSQKNGFSKMHEIRSAWGIRDGSNGILREPSTIGRYGREAKKILKKAGWPGIFEGGLAGFSWRPENFPKIKKS